MMDGQSSYQGTLRYGIQTYDWDSWRGSYRLIVPRGRPARWWNPAPRRDAVNRRTSSADRCRFLGIDKVPREVLPAAL